jgi:dephospho-CoA kinase
MLTVGITGGIGSGKSTVCRVFGVLGIPVFQADSVAARLQNQDPSVKKGLIGLFGPQIYQEDGLLNRKQLAGIIFDDKLLLEEINKIIHPAVHKEFNHWKIQKENQFPYALYEAAILFETGSFRSFDFTILVIADEKERMDRVIKRDHSTAEAVKKRMSNQMKDSEKLRLADFIIENNDNQQIIPQILKLDQILKAKSHVRKMDW